jgi:hypothetical protein
MPRRVSLPPPAPRKDQILSIEGQLTVDLNHSKIKSYADKNGTQWHVGAWVNGAFASCPASASGRVAWDTLVRPGAVDALKLELYAQFTDEESGLNKPFPIVAGLASLRDLCSAKPTQVDFVDPFEMGPAATLRLTVKRPIAATLTSSALWRTAEHNDALTKMTQAMVDDIERNKIRVPEPAKAFEGGLTFLPNGGSAALHVPPVQTSFAALSDYVAHVPRDLPHALLAYYLQHALVQSGLTVDELIALPPRDFAREAGDVLWGLTCDAGIGPYQSDRTLGVGISLAEETFLQVRITPVTSENIGAPFAAPAYIGRTFVPHSAHVGTLAAASADTDPSKRLRDIYEHVHSREFPEVNRTAFEDDCETSAMAGMLAAGTVQRGDMSTEAFQNDICASSTGNHLGTPLTTAQAYPMFIAWTPPCFAKCSAFYTRLQGMLKSGEITVALVVGLAGGAAATDSNEAHGEGVTSVEDTPNLGGHCFAVLRHVGAEGSYVRLLEGTTRTRVVDPGAVRYTARVGDKTKAFPLDQILTLLAQSVARELRVINREVGAEPGGGWKGPRTVRGFARETLTTPCLHSLAPGAEVAFYKWCMTTGLACAPGDVGCMPLDDKHYPSETAGGCRPICLADPRLRAVTAGVDPAAHQLGNALLDEVWPPLLDAAGFRGLLGAWERLEPLAGVNGKVASARRFKEPYTTTHFMETPCAPQLVPCILEAGKIVVAEANRINYARKDGDGIFMTVQAIGTGVTYVLHVPQRSGKLTFMESLRQAKEKLKCPAVAAKMVL